MQLDNECFYCGADKTKVNNAGHCSECGNQHEKYAVYYSGCCEEHGGPEIDYYDTLEQAEKAAYSGLIIFKVVKEIV